MAFNLEHLQEKNTPTNPTKGISELLQREITIFGKPFSNKKKEEFYTELNVLLKAGITLKEALQLIQENESKKLPKALVGSIVDQIISGKSFSDAIKSKKEFTEYEYNSILIGEETGTLDKVTEELGLFFYRKNEQRRTLSAALTYPIIIIITALMVVVFMLRFVVPMFEDIFKQNNIELPWITRTIIKVSTLVNDFGWALLLILILVIIGFRIIRKRVWYRKNRDQIVLKIPYVGKFVKHVYLVQFTQAVALLTSSKVPILRSLQLAKAMIAFYPLQHALNQVELDILKGSSLSKSMSHSKMFDNKMISLVRVAEETNQMEFIFQRLNDQYNIEVQQKSKLLSTVMEPLIIVFVGIIVGFILIAMYLPMFKLSTVLG